MGEEGGEKDREGEDAEQRLISSKSKLSMILQGALEWRVHLKIGSNSEQRSWAFMLLYQSLVRAALVGKCHILWCSTHAGKVAPIARGQSFPKKSQVQGSKNATAQKPGEDIFHSAILNISALSYLMVAK